MSKVSPKTRIMLEMSLLPGIGPKTLAKVARVKNWENARIADLRRYWPAQARKRIGRVEIEEAKAKADTQMESAKNTNTRIVSSIDDDYPDKLKGHPNDPFLLFVKGELPPKGGRTVAISGTNQLTEHGKVVVERIIKYFVNQGWGLICSATSGIDDYTNQAAMNSGGYYLAVMAHGLDAEMLSQRHKLSQQIAQRGSGVVSSLRFGVKARQNNFIAGNRLQVALAEGVVLIQAGDESSSLHAARSAIKTSRWLAVIQPTNQEKCRNESLVRTNIALSQGSDKDKAAILKCDQQDLRRLVILRSRNDYAALTA